MKRIISMVLALIMIISALPLNVVAEDNFVTTTDADLTLELTDEVVTVSEDAESESIINETEETTTRAITPPVLNASVIVNEDFGDNVTWALTGNTTATGEDTTISILTEDVKTPQAEVASIMFDLPKGTNFETSDVVTVHIRGTAANDAVRIYFTDNIDNGRVSEVVSIEVVNGVFETTVDLPIDTSGAIHGTTAPTVLMLKGPRYGVNLIDVAVEVLEITFDKIPETTIDTSKSLTVQIWAQNTFDWSDWTSLKVTSGVQPCVALGETATLVYTGDNWKSFTAKEGGSFQYGIQIMDDTLEPGQCVAGDITKIKYEISDVIFVAEGYDTYVAPISGIYESILECYEPEWGGIAGNTHTPDTIDFSEVAGGDDSESIAAYLNSITEVTVSISYISHEVLAEGNENGDTNDESDPNVVKVYFDANGGSGTMEPLTLKRGDDFSIWYGLDCEFTPPEGKVFGGWNATTDGEWFGAGAVTDDIYVTAIWHDPLITSLFCYLEFPVEGNTPDSGLWTMFNSFKYEYVNWLVFTDDGWSTFDGAFEGGKTYSVTIELSTVYDHVFDVPGNYLGNSYFHDFRHDGTPSQTHLYFDSISANGDNLIIYKEFTVEAAEFDSDGVILSEETKFFTSGIWAQYDTEISTVDFVSALATPGAYFVITRSDPCTSVDYPDTGFETFKILDSFWSGSYPQSDGTTSMLLSLGTSNHTKVDGDLSVHIDCVLDDGLNVWYDASEILEAWTLGNFDSTTSKLLIVSNTSAADVYDITRVAVVVPEGGLDIPEEPEYPETVASGTCGDNLTWKLTSDGTLTIGGTGDMYDYDWVLDEDGIYTPWQTDYIGLITNVVIEDGVNSIGDFAFSVCSNMTSVIIPDSVTSIGDFAFFSCAGLSSVFIPKSVSNIGDRAFASCSSLTEFNVSDDNMYFSDFEGVLFNNEFTKLLYYPIGKSDVEYTIPESVTSVNDSAFRECILTSISIPNGVESIGMYAFWHCSCLTSITIPESVTIIDSFAFYDCESLTEIDVSDNNDYYADIDGVLFNKSLTELVAYPSGKADSFYVIPESVISICHSAFCYCTSLIGIIIPEDVIYIGVEAFFGCSSLASVTFLSVTTKIYDDVDTISDTATIYGYVGSTAEAYAEKYGREFVALHKHTFGCWQKLDADNHIRYCTGTDCDESETKPHTWNNGEVTTEPTCATAGVKTYTCEDCEATYTESVPATGEHNYGKWQNLDADSHIRYCTGTDCDESETKPHAWNNGEVTTEPTCAAAGVRTYTCEDCGATYTEDISATGEHIYGKWQKLNASKHIRYCISDDCEASEFEIHCWNDGKTSIEPTCATVGMKTYACDACEATKTDMIPATGEHVYGPWQMLDSSSHIRYCYNDDCESYVLANHVWYDDSDTSCDICGYVRVIPLDAPRLITNDKTVCQGSEVVVTFKLNNCPEINTIGLSFEYDSSILILNKDKTKWLIEDAVISDIDFNRNVAAFTSSGLFDPNKDIVQLSFTALEDATLTETFVSLQASLMNGATNIAIISSSSIVTVTDAIKGDISGDNVVDNNDAIYLLYYTIFGEEGGYTVNQLCDFDGSGEVDNNDAIYLLYHTIFGADEYPLS